VIAIADEGIGVPEAAREKLFDMFYRADNVSTIKGTGIGLGLAYMSAKAHGGTITCESTLGKGSTFYIRLPLVPVHPSLIPPPEKQ
jgi:signal transduction histidine kinase